jgi:hypothetical protein
VRKEALHESELHLLAHFTARARRLVERDHRKIFEIEP